MITIESNKKSPDSALVYENILHEINTPVSIIYSVITGLETEAGLSAGFLKNLGLAKKNCLHLIKLVNDFKVMKNFSVGNIFPKFVRTDLGRLTRDIVEGAERLAVRKNILVTFTCIPSDAFAAVDREMYQRIVLNLLSNSIKFTPKDGYIYVILKKRKKHFYLSIEDSGPGISEALEGSVFDRYVTDNKTVNKHGTGIGLSIVKSLVSIHNGEIYAETATKRTTGAGTKFTLKLPADIQESICTDEFSAEDMYSENIIQIELSDII